MKWMQGRGLLSHRLPQAAQHVGQISTAIGGDLANRHQRCCKNTGEPAGVARRMYHEDVAKKARRKTSDAQGEPYANSYSKAWHNKNPHHKKNSSW